MMLLSSVFMVSCSGEKEKTGNDSAKADTGMVDINRTTGEEHLESLLSVKDEAELRSKFGERVSYDTIWGSEGMFTAGSYIDKGKAGEVQILWKDSLHRSGVTSVFMVALYKTDGTYDFSGSWPTKSGVKLGMTTDELEALNGKSFTFSGFGWDYGGGIISWNKGKLEDAKMGITLTESVPNKVSDDEMMKVLGDQEIKSDNPVVKKLQPRVARISVY